MPDIYKYSSKHNNFNFPSRIELLSDLNMDIDPSELDEILFHGFDIQNITKYKVYDRRVEGYSVIVTGILQNGERANLVIDQIPIYFDTRISKANTIYEKREIVKIIKESIPNDENEHWEVIERYPGVGFFENKVYYLRYYFQNQWDRKKALKAIKSARNKYETASDVDGSLIQSNIINYEWTFGDWSIVRNYDCHYDEERKIHILFINDPNDFEAVNRPLSAEPPKCQTPQVPVYFHIPMDIEVNGTSDALPTVHNREEKIFMLSGGVYRSDKPDKPLVSFTISHMKCMEDEYQNYMSSSKRQEFMDNDQPDWILILTENEEETLLAYADILGKIQPEFRSQFNGYSFDDPYIVTRIHQYEKLEEFVEKITIVPYSYVNFSGNTNEMFKRVLLDTHIKLEAGVFDSNDNRRRLNYIGSINVDVMCAMKKLNAKDDLLSGHALRAYLDRYGLPKKIDMSIKDMNDYYKDEDGIGMLLASDYCTVDALSCHRIANKVSLFQSYLTLAHLALCTPSDSALRAGGMKVKNVIYCFGKRMDLNYSEYTIPERIEGKYPGAVVFAPVRGRYTEVPTIALDFSSLYPSIMRALWTSSETYIDVDKKPNRVAKLREKGYDVYEFNPKWNYEKKDEDNGGTIEGTIDKQVAFVRHHPDGTECRGVYPKCLEFLTNIRKMYKKKMAKAMDKVAKLEKDIEAKGETADLMMEMFEARLEEKDYNQKQLAVKIISNTIYGKIGSPAFNLFNPYIASTITLTGQKLITAASDVATGKGYIRLYGDTDSIFLLPTVEMMRGTDIPAEKVKICQELAEKDLLPDIHVEMKKITKRDTDVIKMELDKLLYPALYTGKKKYVGTIYEGDKKPHDYISGMEYVKRGKSKLLVDLSKEVVAQVLDLDNNKKVKDMVLEVFKAGIDRIQKEPLDYFVKKAKYRTGKEGFLSLFIERMKQCAVYDPVLYELPDPNTVFEYIITSQEHSILHNGNQRKLKTSDKMEFKHVVEQSPFLKPDYIYYIEDVIGALARFICFHDEFNDDINDNDDDVIDKKSNENAKKYLSEVLKEYMGIKKIKHTIIKRQIKKINAEHSKQYGELLEVLQQGFDRNIRAESICLFITNLCKEVPELSGIEEDNIHKQIRDEEKYIESRKGKLTGIYSRFLNDMNLGSKSEVDDVSIFNKSPKISSSTKDICNKIERLKYLNAVNTKKESTDEIMSLLLDIFK